MKVKQLLQTLPLHLRRDGEIILAHLLKVRPSELYLILEEEVHPELGRDFGELIKRREEGISVAHIIGEWDFYGRTFKLREGILVPRPETELLVEKVLEFLPRGELVGFEIGGGAGNVAITLLLERPELRMAVSEINPIGIDLMRENARLHRVEDRIEILYGSMFEPVKGRVFDFLVSNPPYVPRKAWEDLPPEVKREGISSLVGGEKGYELYEIISKEAKRYLKEGGFVALEIGHDQGAVVKGLLEEAGFRKVMIYKDYSGQDRVVLGWSS